MAYVNENLFLAYGAGGARAQRWVYEGTDTIATVAAAGFISNALSRGMQVGDEVVVKQYSSSAFTSLTQIAALTASAVSSSGATLKSDAAATATAVSGAATLSALVGTITTESLTTAAAAEYTLTLTNAQISAGDAVYATVDAGSSAGTPGIGGCTVTAGQVVITVTNLHASNAFNNTLKIHFRVEKR